MSIEQVKKAEQTLWNSTSTSRNVIPKDVRLSVDQLEDVFRLQEGSDQKLASKPYETKFDESSLAYVVG